MVETLTRNWPLAALLLGIVAGIVAPLATGASAPGFYVEVLTRRPDVRRDVFAGGARLRADLQGFRRVQLRAGCDGPVRRAVGGADRRGHASGDRVRADGRHHGGAGMGDRTTGAAPPDQSGRGRTADGYARCHLFPRRFRADPLGQRHLPDRHGPAEDADAGAGEALRRRHPDQHRGPGRGRDRGAAGVGAGAVLPEDADRPGAAGRCRRSPGRASRSVFR